MLNMFDYQKICERLLADLPPRTRDVLERRYGLKQEAGETLESVGRIYGVTRERARQLETDGLARVRPCLAQEKEIIRYMADILKKHGNVKEERAFLALAGPSQFHNHIFFLLTVAEPFTRYGETEELYPLWTTSEDALLTAKKAVAVLVAQFDKSQRLLSLDDLVSISREAARTVISCVEISKKIKQGPTGLFGLSLWPEVSPRGVKDKAFVVLRQACSPLHFTAVADKINQLETNERKALARTVHNELIKDPRFVLVGRGLYALKEWGYEAGDVKDVIEAVLAVSSCPLAKDEIVERVLKQRLVKPSTILLNLNNNQRVNKDSQGRYYVNV